MSSVYNDYLERHRTNVNKAFNWIRDNIPEVLQDGVDYEWRITNHDDSKEKPDEYNAYNNYFYGANRSFDVVKKFQKAWLNHIHRNPHLY